MVFAGVTSVIAKRGLAGITGESGLAIRTAFVFVFVCAITGIVVPREAWATVGRTNLMWLGASAVTTTLSWLYYYTALAAGEVSTIALIDKGSFVVAVLLAWIVLGEKVTGRVAVGAVLVLAGLFVASRR
jgi:transporter family protein